MKVILPEKKAIKKNLLIIYISIIIVCIISIIISFYVQFNVNENSSEEELSGQIGKKTEEQTEIIKAEFDKIFTNSIENGEAQEVKKKEEDKPIVYTKMEKKESKSNDYDIEVYIPYINIESEKIEKYNKEIDNFVNKTKSVLESKNRNIIYTVEYTANIKNDILFLMIRSNLKEGSNAQRVIIQTFNYDLKNDKEISLEEVIQMENLEPSEVQQNINNEITQQQRKVEDLKNLGYSIYSRNVESDIYKIENTEEFYLTDDTLYIIYPYGNETFTSEMDLVVI